MRSPALFLCCVVASLLMVRSPGAFAEPIEIRSRSRLQVETETQGLLLRARVRVEDDAGEPVAQVPVRLQLTAPDGRRMEFVELTDRAGQARLLEVVDEGEWSLRASWDGRGTVDPVTEVRSVHLRAASVTFDGPDRLFLVQTQSPAEVTWRALVDGQSVGQGAWVATSDCVAVAPSEGVTSGQGVIALSVRRLSAAGQAACRLRLTVADGPGWQGGAMSLLLSELPVSTTLGVDVQAEGAVAWLSDSWLVTPSARTSTGPLGMGSIEVWHEDLRVGDFELGNDAEPLRWTPEVRPYGSLELRLLDDAGALASRSFVPLPISADPFWWLPWVPGVSVFLIVLSWLARKGFLVWLPALSRPSGSRTVKVANEQPATRVENAAGRTSRLIAEDSHTRASVSAKVWTRQPDNGAFEPLNDGADPWQQSVFVEVRVEAEGYAAVESRLQRPAVSEVVVVTMTENRRLVLATFTETLGLLGAQKVPADWWGKRSPSEFLVPAMELVRGLREPSAPMDVRRRRFNELQALDADTLDPVDALEALFLLVDEVCFGTDRPVQESAVTKARMLGSRVLNRPQRVAVVPSVRTA